MMCDSFTLQVTSGTIEGDSNFDAEADANQLRDILKESLGMYYLFPNFIFSDYFSLVEKLPDVTFSEPV